MPSEPQTRTVVVEKLTAQAFAPFGHLVDSAGRSGLHDLPHVFEGDAEAAHHSCALLCVDVAVTISREVLRLERHPFSAQSFVPIVGGRCLVVVSPSLPSGLPDIRAMRAFVAEPPVGITYGRGVWHHSVLALTAPSRWLVLMRRTGRDDDNAFFDLANPVRIEPLDQG